MFENSKDFHQPSLSNFKSFSLMRFAVLTNIDINSQLVDVLHLKLVDLGPCEWYWYEDFLNTIAAEIGLSLCGMEIQLNTEYIQYYCLCVCIILLVCII